MNLTSCPMIEKKKNNFKFLNIKFIKMMISMKFFLLKLSPSFLNSALNVYANSTHLKIIKPS